MADIRQSIAHMRDLLAQPSPAMRCESCATGHLDQPAVRVFACRHEVGAPATPAALDILREVAGLEAAADFVVLYSAFGELVLFRSVDSADDDETALVHFVAIDDWNALKQQLDMWLESLEEEDWEEEPDPDYPDEIPRSVFRFAVPFAQVPHSADLIFVASDGDYAGQIFQMDHETLSPMLRAASLAEFVEVIAADTDRAVDWFSGDIRFNDDEDQWYPVAVAAPKVEA